MAAASKQERPDPQERADLFIAQHQAAYSEAITEAREAAATTATSAWQTGYKKNMADHREIVAQHVKAIMGQCNTIKTADTCEDFEKDIRDSVKALAEERIRFGAWRSRAIGPFERAAQRCESMATATIRAAEQAERDSPLLDRGLAAEISTRVGKWPQAGWNDETGVVEITDTSTGEVGAA